MSDDPGGVWCRRCGSLDYRTTRTYPCLEGVVRSHACALCGNEFSSLATYLETGTPHGDASGRFTRLAEIALPVQPKA